MATGQSQPRSEVLLGLPAGHVGANLADDLQHHRGAEARNLGRVASPADAGEQLLTSFNGWCVLACCFERRQFDRPDQAATAPRALWLGHLLPQRFHLPIAIPDLLLVGLPQPPRLAECKEMFLFPTTTQAFFDGRRFLFLYLFVTQGQQFSGPALAFEDPTHDSQSADPDQIADHVMKLDVHAFQRLLHLLHLAGRADDMVSAQPLVVLQLADSDWWCKSATQQSVRVQR